MDGSMSSSDDISGSSSFASSSSFSFASSFSDGSSFSLSSSSCRQFSLNDINDATNNFDEERVLGRGGEGKVYLGEIYLEEDRSQKTRVAVKQLNKNSTEFENEIRTVTKIQHPNLVALLGYCNESDEKILIYEYMGKGSLSDYVKKDSRIILSWKQRLNICIGAASGLQHLHKKTDQFRKGIIHRDVKPANILIDENWVAKISDFGMFKLSDAAQNNSTMITTNIKGTRGYFAPEYLLNNRITRKIDVYSFGVVLFGVLCRKDPWGGDDEESVYLSGNDLGVWAQQNVDAQIKAEISEDSLTAFTNVIGGSLRYAPQERPTMDDVVKNLMAALKCHESRLQAGDEDAIHRDTLRLEPPKAPENFTYTWNITNYSNKRSGWKILSGVFTLADRKWTLVVYPTGYHKAAGKYLSLYLELDPSNNLPHDQQIYVDFELRIKCQFDRNPASRAEYWFSSIKCSWGFNKHILLSDLNDISKGYIINDTLTIEAQFLAITQNYKEKWSQEYNMI